jgi:hypothetical protein
MHSFYLLQCSGNLIPACQHSIENTSNNPKQVFEYNYELVLFDIHASRGNQCLNGRRIFQEYLIEFYCQMSSSRQSADSEYRKLVKSNADWSTRFVQ